MGTGRVGVRVRVRVRVRIGQAVHAWRGLGLEFRVGGADLGHGHGASARGGRAAGALEHVLAWLGLGLGLE